MLSINLLADFPCFSNTSSMQVTDDCARCDRRSERRYALPALEVVIGAQRFRAVNWSMCGALIYGLCDRVGARVRGEIGVPGSTEAMPFAATIVRADLKTGNSAICFEDCRTERITFATRTAAAPLQ
jgi:hypothetical protein